METQTQLETIIKEFIKCKNAFILEELKPYFEDGKLCQKVKFRLAEIEDFKNFANQKFEEFIKAVKDYARFMEKSASEPFRLLQIPEELFNKLAGDKLI